MCVSCDDVWVALRQVPPSAMREVAIQVPKVSSSSESTHACVIVRVCCACVRACMCVCVCARAGAMVRHWRAGGDQATAEGSR